MAEYAELIEKQDLQEYEHQQWARWVRDERGTIEIVGVINESQRI